MQPLALSRNGRRIASLGLAGAAAVLLSGCYGITGQEMAQTNAVGDVHVVTSLCLNGTNSTSSSTRDPADEQGCVTSAADEAGGLQLFVSYVVPDSTTEPATIKGSGALGGLTFTKSPEFTAALEVPVYPPGFPGFPGGFPGGFPISGGINVTQSVSGRDDAPTPPATHVVSYASSELPKQLAFTEARKATVTADFDVSAVDTDFSIRTSTGWRWVDASAGLGVDRPINCAFFPLEFPDAGTSCNWSTWSPDEAGPPSIPLNKLAITSPGGDYPAAAAVTAGETTTVSFPAKSKLGGETPMAAGLAASSTIPGATVVAPTEYALGTNDPIQVTVEVPAGTAAGDYDVRVSAGDDRPGHQALATLRVSPRPAAIVPVTDAPAPPAAPSLTVPQKLALAGAAASKQLANTTSGKALRQGKARASIDLPAAGFVRVSLLGQTSKGKGKKAPVIAVGTATSASGGLVNLLLRRTAEGKRYLHGKKTVSGTLVIRFEGKSGKTNVTTPITLTLP